MWVVLLGPPWVKMRTVSTLANVTMVENMTVIRQPT